jgi:hypothetical protein
MSIFTYLSREEAWREGLGGVATGVARERWRRALLILGMVVTGCGILHHVDHVVRGNHSGWPFREAVTPFTFSLLIYALLLPGIYMNLRGRVAAGWWLFVALVGLALVFSVHFVGAEREAPVRDIYAVYGSPVWGVLALVVLFGLLVGLAALAVTAFRAVVASRARA